MKLVNMHLQTFLSELDIDGDVEYSEQGMQGDDYVDIDVDEEFIRNWCQWFPE